MSVEKKLWKCVVCGEILEGPEKPLKCPVCGAGEEAIIPYEPEATEFVSTEPLKLLLIGSGTAAFNAALEARKRNKAASIEILSREPYLPYFRPTVTKKIAQRGTAENSLIKPQAWYDEQKITVTLNTEVTAIHPESKTLTLADKTSRSYDKLLIATGASAFIPPFPGSKLSGVITLREYTDAENLHRRLADGEKKIAVIGGGLLGLETAWALIRLGHNVTVIEALPSILPRQIDPEGAPMLAKRINAHCKMVSGICVESIEGVDHVTGVRLKDGSNIPADLVVISAGIRSNIQLAQSAGIACEQGITVNERMETSLSDIYAAGDCAVCQGIFNGLWETAVKQGQTAGANMVGDRTQTFTAQIAGATFFAFGTTLFSVGDLGLNPDRKYEVISARDEIRGTYKKFFFSEKKMVGGVLLGDVNLTPQLLKGVSESITADEAFDIGIK